MAMAGKDSIQQLLFAAAFEGNLQLLKKLAKELDNGEGVKKVLNEVSDSVGNKVIHCAVAGEAKIPMCKYLVEELNLDVNVQDDTGETPLHGSTLDEDYVTTAYLLDHGADPNMVMDRGFTPLHFAVRKGQKDILRLLIKKGAKVDYAPGVMGTPLHAAASHGVQDSVQILLENHANPNIVCQHSLPPLIVAIHGKSIDCVRLLLKWGADPNVTSWGMTPLVEAVSEGETEMISCLLSAGADPDVPDFYDRKPIEIAAIKGNYTDVMALYFETTEIESIHDWSIRGVLEYCNSDEYKNKQNLKREEKFWEAKAKGAEAVNRGHYMEAAHWYTEAMSMKPIDAALLSNRSLCWLRLKEGDRALNDAMACVMLRENWPKAHYRAGMAWQLLRDYRRAAEAFETALRLDPENKEIQEAYRDAILDLQAVMMHQMKNCHPYPG